MVEAYSGPMRSVALLPKPATVWTAPCVVVGLVGGFGIAQATDIRALGGIVLLAGGALAARTWFTHSVPAGVGLSAGYLAGFVASHPLAKVIGAWPSVAAVTATVAGAAYVVVDRHRGS